jgi:gluconolactonase
MLASPDNLRMIGGDLDHPESLCIDEDGTIFCGGEAGQVYRIDPDGSCTIVGSTGGNLLGVIIDGDRRAYACDYKNRAVFRVDPDGTVATVTTGAPDRPLTFPNHPVFDADGNLFVSDSGDYFHPQGTGAIFVHRPDGRTEVFHDGPFRFANGVAISPDQRWLYVAQSAAWSIVRIPLDRPHGPVETMFRLPDHTICDGMTFAADGTLVVACYRPDQVIACRADGSVDVLVRDPTAELILAPTNVALHDGELFISNLGGYHLTAMATDLTPAPVHRPRL